MTPDNRQDPEDDPRGTRLAAGPAALCGLLAVVAALTAGDLVAGLVSPPSSPFLAVGGQFIRLTPEWLKEFAIAAFGVYDKVALRAGMTVVLAVVAVVAGLASRRNPRPGQVVVVVLGLVAALSTIAAPAFGVIDLAAPLVATVAGLGVFTGLHRLARPTPVTPGGGDASGVGRRRFLLSASGVVLGAGVAGVAGRLLSGTGVSAVAPLPPASGLALAGADFAADGTPPWLTANADFYRIDTALQVPQVSTGDYALRIHGMVDRELRLSYDDLRARRLVEAPITMTCVSNEVGGDLVSNAVFVGVPLADLLAEAGVRPGAEQIASTSVDGFTTGTPVAAVVDGRDAMLAVGMNGAPLPVEHGFPVRMVVPGLYGYVSGCKWLVDMEITTFAAFSSYWAQRGWAEQAPVKTASRIDVPRPEATVAPGAVTVAGTAWAQHTGIDRVEVRVDGGPWITAELARDVTVDAWRMWRARVDLTPGRHEIAVRATDRSGYTQTLVEEPVMPDGATGWHTVAVTAG